MKSLKALVIGMGLLIVVGLALVGYGLFRNGSATSRSASSGPGAVAAAYFNVELPVPADSRLEQMAVAGDRVILRIRDADGERILVLDPQTGHVAGTIALVRQKP